MDLEGLYTREAVNDGFMFWLQCCKLQSHTGPAPLYFTTDRQLNTARPRYHSPSSAGLGVGRKRDEGKTKKQQLKKKKVSKQKKL